MIEQSFKDPQILNQYIIAYEVLAELGARAEGAAILGLPQWMRLVPYFCASAGVPDPASDYLTCSKVAFDSRLSKGPEDSSQKYIVTEGLSVCVGDLRLNHKNNNVRTANGYTNFFQQTLSYGFDTYRVGIYSAPVKFDLGPDFSQINQIGLKLFFENFDPTRLEVSDVRLVYPTIDVDVKEHTVTITPKSAPRKSNIDQLIDTILNAGDKIIDQLPKELQDEASKRIHL